MTHEVVEIEAKNAGTVHVLVGKVTDMDKVAMTVDVDIDDYDSFFDIPIFYHCSESKTIADGSPYFQFAEGDRVIIVNYGDAKNLSVANMKVVGFEDGLPRYCRILCEDITDEDLGTDFASDIEYEISYNRRDLASRGEWTETIDTDNSQGLKITEQQTSCNSSLVTSSWPVWAVYDYTLAFNLKESSSLTDGWYYLSYDFSVVKPTITTIISNLNEWQCPGNIQAEALCRIPTWKDDDDEDEDHAAKCRFAGHYQNRYLEYFGGEECEYGTEDPVDCGNDYSGSLTQCIELLQSNKGSAIHVIALNIQQICYLGSKNNRFSVDWNLAGLEIQISNLSLRKVKKIVEEAGTYIVSSCNEVDCVSSATWSGHYVWW